MKDPLEQPSDAEEIERLRRESKERAWRSNIDQIIDEAQKKGFFDNLPGKGKPLRLKKNPYAEESALAYELLQNNDYTLPWIAERKEIAQQIAALRADLLTSWRGHQGALRAADDGARQDFLAAEWQAYLQQQRAVVAELNEKIARVNLTIPVGRLEILKLRLDRELQRIGARDAGA